MSASHFNSSFTFLLAQVWPAGSAADLKLLHCYCHHLCTLLHSFPVSFTAEHGTKKLVWIEKPDSCSWMQLFLQQPAASVKTESMYSALLQCMHTHWKEAAEARDRDRRKKRGEDVRTYVRTYYCRASWSGLLATRDRHDPARLVSWKTEREVSESFQFWETSSSSSSSYSSPAFPTCKCLPLMAATLI